MHFDMVFKAFVGVLAAVIIIGSGMGVTAGFSENVAADNYFESVCKTIVESNYNQKVIEAYIQEAKEYGYVLEVNLQPGVKAGVKTYAEIRFTYYFEIKLFGLKQQKIKVKII